MEFVNLKEVGFDASELTKEQFSIDVLTGLCSKPKTLSAKYFYDDRGSELFQKITQHPDYYPTNSEFEILSNHAKELVPLIEEKEIDIIELGVGDGHKTLLVINAFLEAGKKVNFYPIDISEKAMHLLKSNIPVQENLSVHGIVGEYFQGLAYARSKSKNRQLVLFLGSNIGNFNPAQCQGFLRGLWKNMNDKDLALIGFDLKKNIDTLLTAYNDSSNITRDFNLNLLNRINKELGANFDSSKFQHFGTYNPKYGAMESYLISTEAQEVYIEDLERSFRFKAYEPIHLEYSFKFLPSEIEMMSEQTGFKVVQQLQDSKAYFIDSLWEVKKKASR